MNRSRGRLKDRGQDQEVGDGGKWEGEQEQRE